MAHENYKRRYLKFRYEICKYLEDLLRVVVVPVLAEVDGHLLDLLHRLRVNVEETHNLVRRVRDEFLKKSTIEPAQLNTKIVIADRCQTKARD